MQRLICSLSSARNTATYAFQQSIERILKSIPEVILDKNYQLFDSKEKIGFIARVIPGVSNEAGSNNKNVNFEMDLETGHLNISFKIEVNNQYNVEGQGVLWLFGNISNRPDGYLCYYRAH
jgi:hypothetical protein